MSFSKHRCLSEQLFARGGAGGGLCEWAAGGTIPHPAVTRLFAENGLQHLMCQQQLRGSDSLLSWGTGCKGRTNLPWTYSDFLLKDSRDRRGGEYQGQKWNIAKSVVYLCWCPQKKPQKPKPKKPMWSAYLKSIAYCQETNNFFFGIKDFNSDY